MAVLWKYWEKNIPFEFHCVFLGREKRERNIVIYRAAVE